MISLEIQSYPTNNYLYRCFPFAYIYILGTVTPATFLLTFLAQHLFPYGVRLGMI